MEKGPDSRELENRIELLKKDFKLMEANVDKTLNAMRKEAAERSESQTKWMIGIVAVATIIIIGVLG